MVIDTIFGVLHEKSKQDKLMGDIPITSPVNQGITAGIVDIDSCRYAPKATMQYNIETYGSQNSPVADQDIVIVGNFNGFKFVNLDSNNILNSSGCAVINPTVNSRVSNNMLFQGFDVMDGDLQ